MKQLMVIMPVVFALVLPLLSFAQSWECEACPQRSLARFDLDVQVSEADMEKMGRSPGDYASLYFVAAGVFNALFEEDPSHQCLSFYEGSLGTQISQGVDTVAMQIGDYHTSLPPAPGEGGSQYILTGSVTRSGGKKLSVTVAIFTEETRELVAEAQHPYDFELTGFDNGRLAAQQLMPLMGRIRAYEQNKRDEDPDVAIEFLETNSGKLAIMPDKEKMKARETMDVKIRVTDCDEQPLRGLELRVSVTGGAIDPLTVNTDSNGEATVNYTAPCEAGTYAIGVSFNYFRPFESKNRGTGEIPEFSAEKEILVEPGQQFRMIYQHTSTQEYGGQFLLSSVGDGIIVCTINNDTDPPEVTGVGMVVANWTGHADECAFSGKGNFKVNYEGKIIPGEGNSKRLEMRKISEKDMGGKFSITCAGYTQEVPASLPIPVQEEDRVLVFDLSNGAANAYDVPGTDTHYSYTLEMGCD